MNATGHGYNDVTRTFDWSHRQWNEFLVKVPDESKFRDKPLEFENELRTLFDSVQSTGDLNWNPLKKGMPLDSGPLETKT
ncbi:hypothetical protein AQUCO_02900018v1 [Aquilegia coerulea]|uniref:Myb/SANT-like domain-containing protein n=1 Tax=Aquilegia coerulea TaxID=218851 RepID=A0A2G5D322_AQUCA|nr:hypothetical protein AQUCO_03200116v1 [Aquilegia coerulea]PIA37883.1 hypothetical protein AQUCO_02900018v1 [Aquilegia coerulea]